MDKNLSTEVPHTDEQNKEEILKITNIKLGLASVSKEEAIKSAGELLKNSGYVEAEYIDGMLKRESLVSTYLDHNIAIPHGEADVKEKVKKTGIVILQYPQGIDYGNGNIVKLVIGIAGKGNEHIDLIAKLAGILDEAEEVEKLVNSTDANYIYECLK